MEKTFNKLVRDKIPDKILNNGEEVFIRLLSDEEFKEELENKLIEECTEVISSQGNERLEELGDLLEVLKALAKIENKSLDDIIKIADEKAKKRGTFNNKIFLEKTRSK